MKTHWMRSLVILCSVLLFASCGDSGGDKKSTDNGGGGGNGGGTTVAPYTGAVTISMLNDSLTVTWDAVAGDSYNIRYAGDPASSGVTGALLNTTPVTTSPQTFDFSGSGYLYLWVTRVVGSSESGYATTVSVAYAQLLDFSLEQNDFKFTGPTVSLQSLFINGATGMELHRLPDATTAPSAPTLVDSGTSYTDLTDTVTSFVDSTGAPLTYYYAVLATGTNGTIRRYETASVSPALAQFSLTPSSSSTYYPNSTGTFAATATMVYWPCGSTFLCGDAKTSYETGATVLPQYVGVSIGKILVETISTADWVYFLYPHASSGKVGRMDMTAASPNCGVTGCFTAPFNNGVTMAQDATYLYVATSSGVSRIAKSALTGTTAGSTLLVGGLTGLTDMAMSGDGLSLYLATSTGIYKLIDFTGGSPSASLFWGTVDPVKALALDATGNKLYFQMASAVPANTGADALYELDVSGTPSSDPAVQDRVYAGANLTFNGGLLAWTSNGNAYSLLLSSSTLKKHASGAGPLLLDTDGSLFLRVSTGGGALHLPAAWAYNPALPGAQTAFVLSIGDEVLSLGAPTFPANAEALQVTQDSVEKTVITTSNYTLSSLTNGVTYAVGVVPLNILGAGTGSTTDGTPEIAEPYSITATPKNGAVDLQIGTTHPRARDVTLNLYAGAARPVSTADPPTATLIVSASPGGNTSTLTHSTANGTLFYYNVTVSQNDATSVSDPYFAASSEAWSNAATAATAIDGTGTAGPNLGSIVPPSLVSNAGPYLYWLRAGGSTGSTGLRRDDTSSAPSIETVSANTVYILDALTTDGADLFGYDTGATVYVVTGTLGPLASVNKTLLLDSTILPTFASAPNAITASAGTVYVGTQAGDIFGVDWNGSSASNQRLVKEAPGGYICELQAFGNELYWTQHPSGVGCGSTGMALRRTLADGSGVIEDVVTLTGSNSYFTHFQAVSVGINPYVYYTSPGDGNFIHRLDLSIPGTPVADIPVAETTSGYFAVEDSSGKIFFTIGDGSLYTLDPSNRRFAHATSDAVSFVIGVSLLSTDQITPKVYFYGGGYMYESLR